MKILRLIINSVILAIVIVVSILLRPVTQPKSDVCVSDVEIFKQYLWEQHNPYDTPLSNKIYKDKIDKLLNLQNYKIVTRDLDWLNASGFSATIFNRIILDDDLTGVSYCTSLVHEVLHYRYFSANERFIQYMTFVVLYESKDPHLRNVGIKYGYNEIGDTPTNRYWCADLIIDYLKKEKE